MTFMQDFGWLVHGVRMIHPFDSEAVTGEAIANSEYVSLSEQQDQVVLTNQKVGDLSAAIASFAFK